MVLGWDTQAAGWPHASERGTKGLQIPLQKVRCINHAGATLAQGDLSAFDLALTNDAANYNIGDDLSGFVCTMAPAAEHLLAGWFVVCYSTLAGVTTGTVADTVGYIGVIRGKVVANVDGTNLTATTDWFMSQAANPILRSDVGALGEKLIAKPLAATTDGTEELIEVLFNGIEGFGSSVGPDT